MNPDPKGEGEPEVLVLDGWADGVHVGVGHVQPLLRVLLGRQEGDQVQRSNTGLSSKINNIDFSFIHSGIYTIYIGMYTVLLQIK